MSQYLLAHDLGTSANKATLYTFDGRLCASALKPYPTFYPQPGFVEQNPEDWWEAVCASTRELMEKSGAKASEIAAVSFSGQMMGCLLVDRQGMPLRNMLIWADTRAQRQAQEMEARLGMEFIYRLTGHRVSASYSAAKLMWVREKEPESFARAGKMLQAKDFIIFRMTGRYVTDFSDASGTNLFDLQRKRWSEDILKALEIDASLLPEALPSQEIAGRLLPEAAQACGLCEGIPVVVGGGDGSCACVGAGVVSEGNAYCALGSSSWISIASLEPILDERMRTFNWVHLDPSLYTPCGTMQAAGYSYSWFHDALCDTQIKEAQMRGISGYELVNQKAASSPPGAGGLLYLPYLLGERSPRWNLDARGAFVGLSVTTTRGDMARAVLEGVGMNLKIILDILARASSFEEVRLIGGGVQGDLWQQILADIWQKPLLLPDRPQEATSMGAAVCAGVGIGAFHDFTAVHRFNRVAGTVVPDPSKAPLYRALQAAFDQAYEGLMPTYEKLAMLRAETKKGHNG